MQQKNEKLEQLIETVCGAHDVEFVLLQIIGQAPGLVLRVMIDKAGGKDGGSGVTLDDCVSVSRDLSTALDAENVLSDQRFRLEVTSPGLERPLVKERDFERFAGNEVAVHLSERLDGRRKMQGILLGLGQKQDVLIESDQGSVSVPIQNIKKANLVYRAERQDSNNGKSSQRHKSKKAAGHR